MIQDLKDLLNIIPKFDSSRKYWLFRTQGGQYYQDFVDKGIIAFGLNAITLNDLNESLKNIKDPLELLKQKISQLEQGKQKRSSYLAGQLYRFVIEMKKGDIVIIPSANSYSLQIGEISEEFVRIENVSVPDEDHSTTPFYKRRKITWLKGESRNRINPILYKMFFSHHTITDITQYADYIDAIISDLYIKGNESSFVLKVGTHKKIRAKDLFGLGDSLLTLVDQFCLQHGIEIDPDINIKINLNSEGDGMFKSKHIMYMGVLAIIVYAIVGGNNKVNISNTIKFESQTKPLLEQITDFLNAKHQRDLADSTQKQADSLELKLPEEVDKVVKNQKNK